MGLTSLSAPLSESALFGFESDVYDLSCVTGSEVDHVGPRSESLRSLYVTGTNRMRGVANTLLDTPEVEAASGARASARQCDPKGSKAWTLQSLISPRPQQIDSQKTPRRPANVAARDLEELAKDGPRRSWQHLHVATTEAKERIAEVSHVHSWEVAHKSRRIEFDMEWPTYEERVARHQRALMAANLHIGACELFSLHVGELHHSSDSLQCDRNVGTDELLRQLKDAHRKLGEECVAHEATRSTLHRLRTALELERSESSQLRLSIDLKHTELRQERSTNASLRRTLESLQAKLQKDFPEAYAMLSAACTLERPATQSLHNPRDFDTASGESSSDASTPKSSNGFSALIPPALYTTESIAEPPGKGELHVVVAEVSYPQPSAAVVGPESPIAKLLQKCGVQPESATGIMLVENHSDTIRADFNWEGTQEIAVRPANGGKPPRTTGSVQKDGVRLVRTSPQPPSETRSVRHPRTRAAPQALPARSGLHVRQRALSLDVPADEPMKARPKKDNSGRATSEDLGARAFANAPAQPRLGQSLDLPRGGKTGTPTGGSGKETPRTAAPAASSNSKGPLHASASMAGSGKESMRLSLRRSDGGGLLGGLLRGRLDRSLADESDGGSVLAEIRTKVPQGTAGGTAKRGVPGLRWLKTSTSSVLGGPSASANA